MRRKKSILRVEILAGLIIGAAAAAVVVAFILLMLVRIDIASVQVNGIPGTAPGPSGESEYTALLDLYTWLLWGFGAVTLSLVILAVTFSGYLRKKMLTPLRDILNEAENYRKGSGTDPETAGASFHELVELLNKRDKELQQMKEAAEARADKAEKRSAVILSALGSAVFSIDSDDNLTLFNRESADLFSLSDDDIGKTFPYSKSEAGRKVSSILKSSSDNQAVADVAFRIENEHTRETRYFSVTVSKSEMGEYAVMINDTTCISELERNAADQKAMADIGATSAGISHEMGNTLCALQGFIDLLARGHSDERTTRIIDETRREVEEARNLINSLCDLSGSPEPITEIIPVSEIAELCLSECKRCKIEHKIYSEGEPNARVRANGKLLRAVIRNILSNVRDSCERAGVEIDIKCTEGELFLSVADDGPGILMDTEDVFRPFSTTKTGDGNMGLGLTVSRRIIRSFGGDIFCRNRKNGGAEFTIKIPWS